MHEGDEGAGNTKKRQHSWTVFNLKEFWKES